MMKIKHFLITRFNLPLFSKDKYGAPTRTDAWLSRRFTLFEKYTIPSVSAQDCEDFHWLCLFAEDTPEKWKTRIDGYKSMSFFYPFYLNAQQSCGLGDYLGGSDGIIADFLGGDEDFIVTTRVDNDDAIHKNMMGRVQEIVHENPLKRRYAINFMYGFQYFEEANFLLRIAYPSNPFLTLVERMPFYRTVLDFDHSKVEAHIPTVNVRDSAVPDWIMLVHGNNVDNDIRLRAGMRPQIRPRSLQAYGLNIQTTLVSNLLGSVSLPLRIAGKISRKLQSKLRLALSD
jgi:hypothetical protein